jgi:hypothetical protein
MPINGQSLGKDLSFTVVTPSGNLTFNGVTDYDIKPIFTDLKHKDLDGTTTYAYIPDGWSISIKLERRDATLDDYFAQLEASYFASNNLLPGTINEIIQESDGSISEYRYTNVVLKYDDAGNWKSDAYVAISLTGMATRKIKVS